MASNKPSPGIRSFSKTFRKVFPKQFLNKQVKRSQVDRFTRKLFFVNFLLFLLAVVLLRPSCLTTRELASKSQQCYLQQISGMPSATHSSIAERITKIPPILMDTLLDQAQNYLQSQCPHKSPVFPKLKVFDTTTWSVSANHFAWAAHNGKRRAARFVYVMDSRTGGIGRIIDAHKSTSDNDAFEAIIQGLKRGETVVFDRGYNRFTSLKRIVQRGGHFVTRWKTTYTWCLVKRRKLPRDTQLEGEWEIIADDIGYTGVTGTPGRILARRIICYRPAKGDRPAKWFSVWTDLRKPQAKNIVHIYVARWPIEVFFRHIKSNLRTVHFPTRSETGVHNWLVVIALSVIFMLILTSPPRKDSVKSLGERSFPFLARWRDLEVLLMNEAFVNRYEVHPKAPPW